MRVLAQVAASGRGHGPRQDASFCGLRPLRTTTNNRIAFTRKRRGTPGLPGVPGNHGAGDCRALKRETRASSSHAARSFSERLVGTWMLIST